MTKKRTPTHTRKTIFMEIDDAKEIARLAKEDGRTFSSFVARLLKKVANESRK